MTTTTDRCHACGQAIPPEGVPLPSEQEEQAEDGKLTRAELEQMTPQQINRRWDEVSRFLEEER